MLGNRLLPLLLCLAAAGCLDRRLVNDQCEWRHPASGIDVGNASDGRHLLGDVELAEELGIRHGDSFREREGVVVAGEKREACTERLFGEIARLHRVSAEDLGRVRGRRDVWFDMATVFVPMALFVAFAARWVSDRVFRRFPPADEFFPAVVAIILMSLAVGGLGHAAGDLWSWQVEAARLGNDHLSYRAFYRPWVRHPILVVAGILVLYVVVAFWRYRAVRSVETNIAPNEELTVRAVGLTKR